MAVRTTPPASPRSGRVARSALIGREAELAAVESALAGGGAIVLVGEAGIGKTTLMEAAVAGRPVRSGGGLGMLSFLPYLPLTRALGPLGDGDAGLVAREVLRRAAGACLVLDDLQWADDATLDLMGWLMGRVPMVAAVRTGDARAAEVLDRLRAAGFGELRVGALTEVAGIELARRGRPALGEAAARHLVELTAGNPLLIVELARSGATTSLRLAIAHRTRGVDQGAQRLLELLAVARAPLPLPADRHAVEVLLDAGLARCIGESVEVRHALIADAVCADLADDALRERHRLVAALVTDPAQRARHLAAAGDRVAAAAIAAEAAASSPPGIRAALLGLAAENMDGPEAPRLRLEAAEALAMVWMDVDAERLVADLPPGDDADEARRQALLSITRWRLGDVNGSHAAIERGMALVAGSGSEVEVRLLTQQAWVAMVERDGRRAAEVAREALAACRRLGLSAVRPLRILATAMMLTDAPEAEFWPLFEEALDEARARDEVAEELSIGANMVGWCEASGRFAEGRRYGEAFVRRARETSMVAAEQNLRASLITLYNSEGDYPAVVAATEALLLEPVERRTRAEVSGYAALALVDLGRFDEAQAVIDAELAASVDDIRGRYDLLWAQAELALATGQPARAEEIADHCVARFDGTDYPDVLFARLVGAWARLELGHEQGLPIVRARAEPDLWSGAVPEDRGIARLAAGDPAAAAEHFHEAADTYARFHRRSEMRCRWAHGEALRRAGRLEAARTALVAAETRADTLRMAPLLGRIHRSLRLSGTRRSTPRSMGGRLTGREREVLALVAGGLTNAQIAARLGIGRPTVARIVSNASSKLGTTSRSQAALEALDLV